MKKRSNDLEETIIEMLTERGADAAESRLQSRRQGVKARQRESQAFMDLFKGTSVWQAAEAAAGRSLILRKKVGNSYLSAKSFAEAISEVLASDATADLIKTVPSLEKRLRVLADEAKRGLIDVKAGLESWFDETMSRAEGAYKRWASLVLFLVGLTFAVLGNASTADVARNLWQDTATRAAVAEAATTLTEDGVDKSGLDADKDGIITVAEANDKLGEFSLPVGWDVSQADDDPANDGLIAFFKQSSFWGAALTIVGWVLTALLVMLGGPFWFDLLIRLVALRGAGPKPPTAA
jgi:hypothetical protein